MNNRLSPDSRARSCRWSHYAVGKCFRPEAAAGERREARGKRQEAKGRRGQRRQRKSRQAIAAAVSSSQIVLTLNPPAPTGRSFFTLFQSYTLLLSRPRVPGLDLSAQCTHHRPRYLFAPARLNRVIAKYLGIDCYTCTVLPSGKATNGALVLEAGSQQLRGRLRVRKRGRTQSRRHSWLHACR